MQVYNKVPNKKPLKTQYTNYNLKSSINKLLFQIFKIKFLFKKLRKKNEHPSQNNLFLTSTAFKFHKFQKEAEFKKFYLKDNPF